MSSQRDVLLADDSDRNFFKNAKAFRSGEKPAEFDVRELSPGWSDARIAEALADHLEGLDVVLMGLGPDQRLLPPDVQNFFDERNIGVEPMATPAAARTFNVLLGEGRRVAAALMVV